MGVETGTVCGELVLLAAL